MRLAALILAVLLAGCALAQRPPAVVVKNDTPADITGEALLYEGEQLVAKWGFTVPGLAHREIARLPREPGDHRLVVKLDDGPSGSGSVASGIDEGRVLVRVKETGVVVEPQRT